jgi:ABC-type multidrug transport system ATPase subunit
LAIATAFLNDPELLLLDEPLTNLDPERRIALTDWLAQQLPGRITIIATHVFNGLEHLTQRLGYLDEGRLVTDLSVPAALNALRGCVWQVSGATANGQVVLNRRSVDNVEAWRILSQDPPQGGDEMEPTLEDVYGALAQHWLR